ncbi:MAG TPA: twin-arginine translocase TatA/TatE family subunit [Candidatus Dormibacteraeota bacterium]|nr:twin-arginine translocase TatA/TatE family subunit [Candidatus Dormibacteraeota bacterium]
MLSPSHLAILLIVLLLALVVFGPKRLPELGSSVGKALQEFRKASSSVSEEVRSAVSAGGPASPPAVNPSAPEIDKMPAAPSSEPTATD